MQRLIHFFLAACTAVVGFHIHGSVFWAIVDFLFFPIAWLKWLICHEVSLSIIQEAFSFLFR